MARKGQPKSKRLVVHTSSSRSDLISIYLYNDSTYGPIRAEQFMSFIELEIEKLANQSARGKDVDGFDSVKVYLAKTSKHRNSHGYRVFYRINEIEIEVIRVLHTAMNWPDHLA